MKRLCIYFAIVVFWVGTPFAVLADIDHVSFTNDPQSLQPSVVSGQITVEAQDAGNTPVNGNSVCMQVTSSSATGEFSTNETNWSSPVSTLALTLSTSQFRRNFYYRDATEGNFTLTVQAALRPGSSCSGWTPGATWTATQTIVVGVATNTQGDQTTNDTPATTTEKTTTIATTTTSQTTANVSSYVPPPATPLFADGGDDRTVIVGADTEFRGRAYNRSQEIIDNVRFNWNFGDGTTAEGPAVLHHFSYPGKYAVMLNVAENVYAGSDRIIVTATPAQMIFTVNDDASVSIENQESDEIDISQWIIRSYTHTFTLPEDTIILGGETLRIANATLGFSVGPQTELLYPNGVPVDFSPTPSELKTAEVSVTPVLAPKQPVAVASPKKIQAPTPRVSNTTESVDEQKTVDATTTQLAAAGTIHSSPYVWWFSAIALTVLACGAAYAVKRIQKNEWHIIDETEEGV